MLLCINDMYTDGVEPNHDAGPFVVVKLSLMIIKHIKITRKRQSCIKRHAHTYMVHCSSMLHNYVHEDADAAIMNYAHGLVVLDS